MKTCLKVMGNVEKLHILPQLSIVCYLLGDAVMISSLPPASPPPLFRLCVNSSRAQLKLIIPSLLLFFFVFAVSTVSVFAFCLFFLLSFFCFFSCVIFAHIKTTDIGDFGNSTDWHRGLYGDFGDGVLVADVSHLVQGEWATCCWTGPPTVLDGTVEVPCIDHLQ